MSKYELQKLFFKKSKKLLMTSFFRSRSRSWSRTLPVSVSKPKLRSRPVLVSVLVSEKFRGLSLGLGLGRVGLDYSPDIYSFVFDLCSVLESVHGNRYAHAVMRGTHIILPYNISDPSGQEGKGVVLRRTSTLIARSGSSCNLVTLLRPSIKRLNDNYLR